MSASLVGSEMCIRDSSSPDQLILRGRQSESRPPATTRPHHGVFPEMTVSYTHLTLPTICSV
eukprot:2701477-Alexandrium_andersonii.AAC.1